MKDLIIRLNQFMSQKVGITLWAILMVYFIGFGSGRLAVQTPAPIIKEVPRDVYVYPVGAKENWESLKGIDDQALVLCSQGFEISASLMDSLSKFDMTNASNYLSQLEDIAPLIRDVSSQRQDILQKLGY